MNENVLACSQSILYGKYFQGNPNEIWKLHEGVRLCIVWLQVYHTNRRGGDDDADDNSQV